MKVDGFWKYLATRDKDTFAFVAIFAFVVAGLAYTNARAIYFISTGCLAIVFYIVMRFMLIRLQTIEREHELKCLSARKAQVLLEAIATEDDRATLEKLSQPAKRKPK